MENKHQVEPLLYIDQPLFQKPVVFMQADYKSNLNNPRKQENEKGDGANKVKRDDSSIHFNARSLDEKIHYLLHLPKEMPHLKCEIRTKERVYVGKLVDDFSDEIEISIFGRPNKQLR